MYKYSVLIWLCACSSTTKEVVEEPSGTVTVDADGDGYPEGEDCNDSEGLVNPSAEELCDGLDNNCDGQIDEGVGTEFFADLDLDGFGSASLTQMACEAPDGYVSNGSDCDDTNPETYPGAEELCDNLDNDCNDQIDDGLGVEFYQDLDGDGFGNNDEVVEACQLRDGLSSVAGDCNDLAPEINPLAPEACDEIDNNCDGNIDEGVTIALYADADGDGYGDDDQLVQACNGATGFVEQGGDCDDSNIYVNPSIPELCDEIDNDCDGDIDEEDANDVIIWYADADADGYGDAAQTQEGCAMPTGYVLNADDCNDSDLLINPDAAEICDSVDNDCDGYTDDQDNDLQGADAWYIDADGDGFGATTYMQDACNQPSGYVSDQSDCDDANAQVNGNAAEVCDEIDNNCDGNIDDADAAVQYGSDDVWYFDGDEDGYGDSTQSQSACEPPSGYVEEGTDCDDTDASLNPETTWYPDADGDGYGSSIYSVQSCAPGSDFMMDSSDCDDTDASIYPGADEYCDNIDQDCDGQTEDDDAVDAPIWYYDADLDDFGDTNTAMTACTQPSGYLADGTDCDDSDDTVFPNSHSIETPFDGIDQDCDGEDRCHDLNCDAWPDLILPAYRGTYTYLPDSYVYYGIGQGTDVDYDATDRDTLATGNAHAAAYGDFDGDGYMDIVFGAYYDGDYYTSSRVYYGSASGFSTSNTADLPAYGVHSVRVDDLDGDGYDDVVLASHYDGDYYTYASIYWGESSGFDISSPTLLGINSPQDMMIEDLNNDGHLDLIFGAYYGSYYTYIYWGDGTRNYNDGNRTDLYAYYNRKISVEDMDQDGQLDLLLPTYGGNDNIWFGDNQDYSGTTTVGGGYSWDMDAADFNDDGYMDVVTCVYYDSYNGYVTSSALYWSSFGSYSSGYATTLPTYGCRDVEVEDVNRDGYEDIIFINHVQGSASNYVYTTSSMVYYGSGGGFSVNNRDDLLSYGATNGTLADLNNDGYPELLITGYYNGSSYETTAYIHWGDPSGYDSGGRTGIPSIGGVGEIQVVGGFDY